LSKNFVFTGLGYHPKAQHPTLLIRVSLFICIITLHLSGLGKPASSYASAGITLEVIDSHKTYRHDKAEGDTTRGCPKGKLTNGFLARTWSRQTNGRGSYIQTVRYVGITNYHRCKLANNDEGGGRGDLIALPPAPSDAYDDYKYDSCLKTADTSRIK
jgi:hypothetical protein